jgi:hypothetical protein
MIFPYAKWLWDIYDWKQIIDEHDPEGLHEFVANHDIIWLKAGTVIFLDRNDLFDYRRIRPQGTDTYYYIPSGTTVANPTFTSHSTDDTVEKLNKFYNDTLTSPSYGTSSHTCTRIVF